MDLRTRLKALQEVKKESFSTLNIPIQAKVPEVVTGKVIPSELQDWEQIGTFTFRKVQHLPFSSGAVVKKWIDLACNSFGEKDVRTLYWFDTETTGLSGGAGTVVFLFGGLRLHAEGYSIEQYFLSDFPGEEEFLHTLEKHVPFTEDTVFISYNGSAYDTPLLKTRFLLQRMSPPSIRQLDLLYLVRRLYKKILPDCSLHTVEQALLHKVRALDIPGWRVPLVYFQFLREGQAKELPLIFYHNQEDLLSLLSLFAYLGRILEHPWEEDKVDPEGLALFLLTKNPSVGLDFLKSLSLKGNCWAVTELSKMYRREGKIQESRQIRYPFIYNSFSLAVEELKYLEHKEKDYSSAIELATYWMSKDLSPLDKAELEIRLNRLKRKAKIC
ncbi:MAG: ribonuclease H-like domain-containing protein [Spirochaetales bacterium]